MNDHTDGIVIDDKEYSDEEMHALIDETITEFGEGDLVSGVIVQVERDEVLLDIGYKSEGVIPARELTIRKDVDPSEVVQTGDEVEALVLQKEDKDGRLILSKKRAEYERFWVTIEEKFDGGPVGLSTLAAAVGEDPGTTINPPSAPTVTAPTAGSSSASA